MGWGKKDKDKDKEDPPPPPKKHEHNDRGRQFTDFEITGKHYTKYLATCCTCGHVVSRDVIDKGIL